MVRISDIQGGEALWATVPYCRINKDEIDSYLLKKDDILFARTGGTVGKSFLVKEIPYPTIYAGYLIRTRYSQLLSAQYMKYFMESQLYWEQLKNGTIATAQPNCNGKTLSKMILPIPPYNEQVRITNKLNEVLAEVNKYGVCQDRLNHLNSKIKNSLLKSILQEAIQGKLVKQDPNEEPASVLLERIKQEKERLIKEKRIKRDKQESIIYRGDDNKYYENLNGEVIEITEQIPFDIPSSWQWVRLDAIFNINMGQSPDGNSVTENGVGIEFHQGKIEFQETYLGVSRYTTTKPTKIAPQNSLLLCVRAPVGVLNITQRDVCIGRGLCALTPYINDLDSQLWCYLLSTYKRYFEKKATGSTFTAISHDIIKGTLIPLPPINEQRRMLRQINMIFQSLN